jgi:cystathionine beta-lyase/cystathionine gamma-synthase
VDAQVHADGGILSALLDANAEQAAAVVDRLRLFAIGPSLGGVESLVTLQLPPSTTACAPTRGRSEASRTA